jgi:hypothetical protein
LHVVYGRLVLAREEEAKTRELAEHFGHSAFLRFLDGGPSVGNRYTEGLWDEALERANAFLVEVESGSPH